MKSVSAGAASGCLTWLLAFGVITLCLCPTAGFVGSFSSTLTADSVARILGPYLCPENSTAEIVTHQTTIADEFGNEKPATGFEMQCVDADGTIVRAPSPDYAFYWIGVLGGGALAVSAILALLFAAPIGAFITRRMQRSRKAGPG